MLLVQFLSHQGRRPFVNLDFDPFGVSHSRPLQIRRAVIADGEADFKFTRVVDFRKKVSQINHRFPLPKIRA